VGVVGGNGSGKSTLFRTLAMFDGGASFPSFSFSPPESPKSSELVSSSPSPWTQAQAQTETQRQTHAQKHAYNNPTAVDNPTLLISGLDVVGDVWAAARTLQLGYVPQSGGLLESLTVRYQLELFGELKSARAAFMQGNGACLSPSMPSSRNECGTYSTVPDRYLDYPCQSLSGGNKKKVAVALANLFRPSLLLLDEPTSGVDPVAADQIIRMLLPQTQTQPGGEPQQPQQQQQLQQRPQGILFASHRMVSLPNLNMESKS
jgi:ABC-type lipoprotein export system ATPase subunit